MNAMIRNVPGILLAALWATGPALATQQDTLALSIEQAVDIALASSLDLQSAQLDTQIQLAGVAAEKARFGRTFTVGVVHESARSPSISALEAVRNTAASSQVLSVGVNQILTSGGRLDLQLRATRSSSNAAYYTINPVYSSALELAFTQPLLRGRGRVNLIDLDLARLDLDGTRADLQERLRKVRAQAGLAYWELFAARNQLAVAAQVRDGAARVLETVTSRAHLGADKRSSILEASVGLAQREEEVVVAAGAAGTAADQLKSICGLDRDPLTLATFVVLLDTPRVARFDGELAAGIAHALKVSNTYQGARLEAARLDLRLSAARNRTLPAVDLNAGVGLTGIGADFGADVAGLSKADGRSWRGGLSVSMPLGGNTQEARYAQRLLEKQRRNIDLEQMERQIARQVREQYRQVRIGGQRIQAARASLRLARRNVQQQEARLSLGLSTVREVLDAQDDLASAHGRLVRAMVDYVSAVIRWQELTGEYEPDR